MLQPLEEYTNKLMLLVGGWYWPGCWGQIGTETLWYQKSHQSGIDPGWFIVHADAKAKGLGKKVLDCTAVYKFPLWLNPDGSVPYYPETDMNESMIFQKAKDMGLKWGAITTIPRERRGILVTYTGHMGCYLGNGTVLEARGGAYGVVITQLDGRGWQYWHENPFVDYKEGSDAMLYLNCPKGEAVQDWQESLLKCGYKMINQSGKVCTADGDFGSGSVNGTNLFKKDMGLPQDGQVDEITYGKMLNKLQSLVTIQTVTVNVPYEVIKEVPVEVIKEVVNTVIKEVPVEVVREVIKEVSTGITQEQLNIEIAKTKERDNAIVALTSTGPELVTTTITQHNKIIELQNQNSDLEKEIVTTAEKTAADIKAIQDAADDKDHRIDVLEETLDELEQKNAELFEQANAIAPKPEEKPEAAPEEPAIVPEVPKAKPDGMFKIIWQFILSFFNK